MAEDDEDQTMDLTIEALTGTIYDLCVSPYETILGIKMKIQRLEGRVMKMIHVPSFVKINLGNGCEVCTYPIVEPLCSRQTWHRDQL